MKYKLRKRLYDDTAYYELDIIDKYVDYLTEQDRVLTFDNLMFDKEAMLMPFGCNTALCVPDAEGKINGRKRKCQCCCDIYAPRLSTQEREKIDKILPAMRKRYPALDKALQKADSYYEWDENYDRMIVKQKKHLCVFQTPDTKDLGFHGCYLHAWCLEKKLSRLEYQPSACIMFPIFILECGDEERVLVTAHTEEVRTLGETEEVDCNLPCMKANPHAKLPRYQYMKDTLIYMFGQEVWNRLDKALQKEKAKR
jgi:hypothetical protein